MLYNNFVALNTTCIMTSFRQIFINSLNSEGYKSTLALLQEKAESDRDFKLIADNLLADVNNYNEFNKRFNERIECLPSNEVLENLGVRTNSEVFTPIRIKFKEVISIYILYLNRLANIGLITYLQYCSGNLICNDTKDTIDNRTYNYIVNVSNYYVINHSLLSVLDFF